MTEIAYRPPRPEELADCALVWHVATDDYMRKLNRPLPPPVLDRLVALLEHLRSTDPERFIVAVRPGQPKRRDTVIGFGIAVQREHVWFLSQLYVLPDYQGLGVGHSMLHRILPSPDPEPELPVDPADRSPEVAREVAARIPRRGVLATTTDSAQPASNGLYASLGIIPRVPLFNLVGRPSGRPETRLRTGIRAFAFSEQPDRRGGRPRLADAVDSIDREVLGYAHRADHRHLVDTGRVGYTYEDDAGAIVGYGYTSASGRFGPVALLDATLTAGVLSHLLGAVEPRGATSVWVPGANDRAIVALLRAGLVIEGFPALLCWSQPFASFERYLPAGPALL